MDAKGQKGVYQLTWRDSDGDIIMVALHMADSPEDAMKLEPDLRIREWKRSVSLVEDKRLRNLLGMLGIDDSRDLRVWFHVSISRKAHGGYIADNEWAMIKANRQKGARNGASQAAD